jgi:hypothetical protein
VSADNGRIREIVKAAITPDADMGNLVFVIRQVLRRERQEGYDDGYADGARDERDARRYEEERQQAAQEDEDRG